MTNRTEIDIELSRIYFDILVTLAKTTKGQTIYYSELAQLAKAKYPNSPHINAAIATNMGRRLDAVRAFTSANQMPDLSALVINRSTGDNGEIFLNTFDGEAIRKQVSEFDWQNVKIDFENFLTDEIKSLERRRQAARRPRQMPEADARQLWWDFCKANPEKVAQVTLAQKEQIIALIIQWKTPEEALQSVCGIS